MMEEKGGESKSEESEHESEEDESEILEESPCGRWLKRSEEVSQRNVPGIDRAYLAMDSEEGVEVVWNEVQFSERKSFKQQEEKIKAVFDNLMQIDHANIVKFHRYWIDYTKEQQKTRVVFITEYMSSGSVKEFLHKTKDIQKYKRNKSWKRWCTQILSALSYLHNYTPPVIHANMTCDTIFIQHNGLVKIGSVAPDAIRNHVKTYQEIKRNMHYYAPEYGAGQGITPAVDIYSFGICALEMAVPRTQLHYRESKSVTDADINRAIEVLDDLNQKDFIRLCLRKDPKQRPSARSLLLHPVLFEVHSLKLLAAHAFVKNQRILPEYKPKTQNKDVVIAQIVSSNPNPKTIKLKDVPAFDVDKFLEDVKNGVYPLTSFALPRPPGVTPHSSLPSQAKGQVSEGHPSNDQSEEIPEARKILHAQGTLTPLEKNFELILQLRFEDKTNRHLNCEVEFHETAEILSSELVQMRLIKETDKNIIKQMLEEGLKNVKMLKSTIKFTDGSVLKSESSEEIPSALSSVIHPPVNPLDEAYQLLQSQLAPQAQNQLIPGAVPSPAIQPNPQVQMLPQQMVVQPPASLQLQTHSHLPNSTLPQAFQPQLLLTQQTIPFPQQMQFVQTSQVMVTQPPSLPLQQRNVSFQAAAPQSLPGQTHVMSPTTHLQTTGVLSSTPYVLPMLASQPLAQLSNQMHFQQQPIVGQASTINPLLLQQQALLLQQQQQLSRFPTQVLSAAGAMPRMVTSMPQHTQSSNNSNNIGRLDFGAQRFVQNSVSDQDTGVSSGTSLDLQGSGGSGDVTSTKPP